MIPPASSACVASLSLFLSLSIVRTILGVILREAVSLAGSRLCHPLVLGQQINASWRRKSRLSAWRRRVGG